MNDVVAVMAMTEGAEGTEGAPPSPTERGTVGIAGRTIEGAGTTAPRNASPIHTNAMAEMMPTAMAGMSESGARHCIPELSCERRMGYVYIVRTQ